MKRKGAFNVENLPVLLTGGGGFLGANLIRALVKEGAKVFCLLRPGKDYWRLIDIPGSFEVIEVDLEDCAGLTEAVRSVRPRVIYHLAAYGNSSKHKDFGKMLKVNIAATARLLESLKNIPYDCLVFAGTSSEYGFKDHAMREGEPEEPMSYYGITKLAATHLCRLHSTTQGKRVVTLRLFSVYGPYEDPGRFIPTALCAAMDGAPLPLTEGKETHDFVYVDDVTEAFLRAPSLEQPRGRVINACSGVHHTNREVVEIIEKVLGTRVDVRSGAYRRRSWDTELWLGDNSLAADLLGWRPRFSLAEGLAATASWIKGNRERYPGRIGR